MFNGLFWAFLKKHYYDELNLFHQFDGLAMLVIAPKYQSM